MKKSVCLFFGSFNPFHKGHANMVYICNDMFDFDEIWIMVTPQNPDKDINLYAPLDKRIEITKSYFKENTNILIKKDEEKLSPPYYTINTMEYLEDKYKTFDFSIMCGTDMANRINGWSKKLIKYSLIIFNRNNEKISVDNEFQEVEYNNDISSTIVRNEMNRNEHSDKINIESLKIIIESNLYK